MPTSQKSKDISLVQNPGQLSNALANVISVEGGRDVLLGQAWIAAPGRLVTCGHVVERFVNAPGLIIVRFPASSNKYKVKSIRLHPRYVRRPDHLVKFDVAVLEVVLQGAEATAMPLPFSFGQEIATNQELWAIDYPTHLAGLGSARQPLTQDGHYRGPLDADDTFHFYHDVPLAPGDSGAPITDGAVIIGIHCGDTATVPGLNVSTTSFRLALWVDSLRDLGIVDTVKPRAVKQKTPVLPAILAFILSALIAGFAAWLFFSTQAKKEWSYENPAFMPVTVSFNEPIDNYKTGENIVITLTPSSKCYLYLFSVDSQENVCVLYPTFGLESRVLKPGEQRIINQFGSTELTADPSKGQVYLVAVSGDSPNSEKLNSQVKEAGDLLAQKTEGKPLPIKGSDFVNRLNKLKEANEDDLLFVNFIGPHSK